MELIEKLRQFKRSYIYHQHYLNPEQSILLSEGCQFLKEQTNCSWLFDHIIKHRNDYYLADVFVQKWTFHIANDERGLIWCKDSDDDLLYAVSIKVNDFPIDSISVILIDDTVRLMNEY